MPAGAVAAPMRADGPVPLLLPVLLRAQQLLLLAEFVAAPLASSSAVVPYTYHAQLFGAAPTASWLEDREVVPSLGSRHSVWPEWPASLEREFALPQFSGGGSVSNTTAYARVTSLLRAAVRGEGQGGLAPIYVLEAPSYFVEHLLPLVFAVPGWLLLLRGGLRSASNARLAHERYGIPRRAMLWVDPLKFDIFHDRRRTLLLGCTEPRTEGAGLPPGAADALCDPCMPDSPHKGRGERGEGGEEGAGVVPHNR